MSKAAIRPPLGAASPEAVMTSRLTRAWIAWPRGARAPARPISARLSPAATRICACTRSTPKTSSVTVCSTCRRGLASMKANEASSASFDASSRNSKVQRLSTPAVGGEAHGRAGDALAQSRRQRRARRDLDQLLVAALDRAFPLAEMRQPAVAVAENLDLDMAGAVDQALGVERPVAEGARRLRLAAGEGVGDFVFAGDRAHAAPAAAGDRFQHDRRADARQERPRVGRAAQPRPFDHRGAGRAPRDRAPESCRRTGRAFRAKARRRSVRPPRPRGRRTRSRRESRSPDERRRSPSPAPARSGARRRDRRGRPLAPAHAPRPPCARAARPRRPRNRRRRWRRRDRRPRARCGWRFRRDWR